MTRGPSSGDVAHLLGAVALVLSFALLQRRRVDAAIRAYAAQAAAVSLAAAWQGFVQGAPQLHLAALLTLAAGSVLLPSALRRIARRLGPDRTGEEAGASGAVPLGLGVVALAALAVPAAPRSVTPEGLVLALSVVLLGPLVALTRRGALPQAVGFLSMGNGLILAAVGAPGLPLAAGLVAAVLALAALAVLGAAALAPGRSGRAPR